MTPEQSVAIQLEEDPAALILRLLERTITNQEALMTALADSLKTLVDTNSSLAQQVIALANSATPDTVLQPIVDVVTATNAALQAALPPAPPPAQ